MDNDNNVLKNTLELRLKLNKEIDRYEKLIINAFKEGDKEFVNSFISFAHGMLLYCKTTGIINDTEYGSMQCRINHCCS